MEDKKEDKPRNHLALWAGVTAALSNLAAISVVDILGGPDTQNLVIAAFATSLLVGGTVWSRQHLEDEKSKRKALHKNDEN